MEKLKITRLYMTQSPCYTSSKRIVPSGIVVHSTGANNPKIKRYVQPDDGVIGVNANGNHWNKPSATKGVHAFIGKTDKGDVRVYQVLPWNRRAWGVASGSKGSYNNSHVQFEICEDNLNDSAYYQEAFDLAVKLCAYLCDQYGIGVSDVVGHYEAAKLGYANDHVDPSNWMPNHGDSMDNFRDRVLELIGDVAVEFVDVKPLLQRGDADEAVTDLQNRLLELGYGLPQYGADGDFGAETEKAVRKFQTDYGLTADGVVGTQTWSALDNATAIERITYKVTINNLSKDTADEIVRKYGGVSEKSNKGGD